MLEVTADGERLDGHLRLGVEHPLLRGAPSGWRRRPVPTTGCSSWCSSAARGRAATFAFALDVLRAAHVRRRDVEIRQVREVTLAGPAGSLAQVDGDVCQERLPLSIRLAPERLLVLAPDPVPGVRQS